jgi:L-methionine (R)-S-oxide reductase
MAESFILNDTLTDEEKYLSISDYLTGLIDKDNYILTNLSNFIAVLKQSFEKISWIGFYIFDGKELVLGPFQGKVACTKIEIGKGVCGNSFKEKRTLIVPDVNQYPGHIACDAESKSEIVVPLINGNRIFGVLDIDSYKFNSFNELDKNYLEMICDSLLKKVYIDKFIIS